MQAVPRTILAWLILGSFLGVGRAAAAPRTSTLEGVITGADLERKPALVTVEVGDSQVILKVGPATSITGPASSNAPAARRDPDLELLRFGVPVRAVYYPATRVAKSIRVTGSPVLARNRGRVTSIDTVAGRVQVDFDGATSAALAVDEQTRLTLGPTAIARVQLDLLAGQTVDAEYEIASQRARSLAAVLASVTTIGGRVTAVDPAALRLSAETDAGTMDLVLAGGADLRILGRRIAADTLLPGDTLRLTYALLAPDTRVLLAAALTGVRLTGIQGLLSSVDAAAGRMEVRVSGARVSLQVTPETSMKLNGKGASLADLAAALALGRPVLVSAEYLERQTVNIATQVKAAAQTRR